MKLRTISALTVALAFAPIAPMAMAPAAGATCSAVIPISSGHQDLAVMGDASSVRTGVIDDSTGSKRTLDSGDAVFRVADSLQRSMPASGDLPTSGWVLPQIQDYSVPWVGFSTIELDPSLLSGRPASLTMEASGPGRVVAWQPGGLGQGMTTIFDSDNPSLSWELPAHTHAHTGFIFTEPGAYWLTFTYSIPGHGSHDLRAGFLVGDETTTDELCATESGSPGESTGIEGIATEIGKLDKAIADLDKVVGGTAATPTKPSAAPASPRPSAKDAKDNKDTKDQASTRTSKPSNPGGEPKSPAAAQQAQAPAPAPAQSRGALSQAAGNLSSGAPASSPGAAPSTAAAALPRPGQSGGIRSSDEGAESVDVEATAASSSMVNFWGGVLAGIGGLALAVGGVLLAFVKLSRPSRPEAEAEV